MVVDHFHFENPLWLWGLLAIPLIGMLYKFFYANQVSHSRLEAFVDKGLLPHLLIASGKESISLRRSLTLWSILWALLMGALANPQWNYREVPAFLPDQNLCILLDVSQSMDAQDVKPSRLIRARQKIEDILNMAEGIKISLIAFAADPHMIVPLTDDTETIRQLLPSIGTDLVHVQGSRLSPALTMASRLFDSVPGHNKSILIITDGGFEDGGTIGLAHQLAQKGLSIYTLGIGTREGAPIPNGKGNFFKKDGETIISKLDTEKLDDLSQEQNLKANYLDEDIKALINQIKAKSKTEEKTEQTTREWEERFYFLVFPAMAILLFWFRREFLFPLILFSFLLTTPSVYAAHLQELFKNEDQLGKEALEKGNYEGAIQNFKDSYRKGIAHYKAGHYAEAEKLFQESQRPEVATDALYNLGNTFAMQNKYEEAKKTYEKVLEKNPTHSKARHNLEIVKKILEKEQKENQQNKENNKSEQTEKSQSSSKSNEQKNGQDESQSDKQDFSNGKREEENSSEQNPPSSHDKGTGPHQENNKETDQEKKEDKELKEEQGKGSSEISRMEKEEKPYPTDQEIKGSNQKDDQKLPSSQAKPGKAQQDIDADQWLDQIQNDPKSFLKNQFYIESQRNESQEGIDPW